MPTDDRRLDPDASDANPEFPALPAVINVYNGGCDAAYRRAAQGGRNLSREPSNQFYGDRSQASKMFTATSGGSPRMSRMCSGRAGKGRMKARESQ